MLAAIFVYLVTWINISQAQNTVATQGTNEIRIVELQGAVEVSPSGATIWALTQTNQILRPFDRLRTGANSRVALRWSDQSIVPFGASTELEILPPHSPEAQSGLHLIRGIISFFHRAISPWTSTFRTRSHVPRAAAGEWPWVMMKLGAEGKSICE